MTLPTVKAWDPYGNKSTGDTISAEDYVCDLRTELEAIKKERDEAVALTAHLALHIESLILALPENIRTRCLRSADARLAGVPL